MLYWLYSDGQAVLARLLLPLIPLSFILPVLLCISLGRGLQRSNVGTRIDGTGLHRVLVLLTFGVVNLTVLAAYVIAVSGTAIFHRRSVEVSSAIILALVGGPSWIDHERLVSLSLIALVACAGASAVLYAGVRNGGWLIDTVRDELAQGRGVAVFCRQTGERDIQPRIARLLTEHIPTARPFILTGRVEAAKREELLQRQVAVGANVLICNPKLVQTGLDLLDFPTIIFLEVDYSLFVMSQAARRAWRLIQDKECRTYYPYYVGLMEERAVQIIASKQAAANLLYGEGDGGLSALSGESDCANLLAALAKEIDRDEATPDLRALFAQHAHTVDLTESAWFVTDEAEVEPAVIHVEPLAATAVTLPESTTVEPLMLRQVVVTPHTEQPASAIATPPQGYLFDVTALTVATPAVIPQGRRKRETVPLTATNFMNALQSDHPLVEALGTPTLTAIGEQLAAIGNRVRQTKDRTGARTAISQALKRGGYPRAYLPQAVRSASYVCGL